MAQALKLIILDTYCHDVDLFEPTTTDIDVCEFASIVSSDFPCLITLPRAIDSALVHVGIRLMENARNNDALSSIVHKVINNVHVSVEGDVVVVKVNTEGGL